jgi:hypothetical protein
MQRYRGKIEGFKGDYCCKDCEYDQNDLKYSDFYYRCFECNNMLCKLCMQKKSDIDICDIKMYAMIHLKATYSPQDDSYHLIDEKKNMVLSP